MGWELINSVPNVSGGLGMFDKEIAIKAGGYGADSHAEDMDQLITKLNESEGFVSCYWSENKDDELKIKELTKATIRCYPLDNNDEKQSINKENEQGKFAIFSKSY